MNGFDPRDVSGISARIVRAGPICDECLGRVAAKLGKRLANAERGRAIRGMLAGDGIESRSGTCWVCGNLFDRVPDWARRAARRVAEYEFGTYLFGVQLTPRLEQMEAFYQERFPSEHRESLKHSVNRAVGMAFERLLSHRATVDFKDPHVSFVVDPGSDELAVRISSLYAYGRYRKLERGIPQTRWPCRRCGGRGCAACGFSGKQYPKSVEEIVAAPLIEMSCAESAALHGAGREDIDARMLGNGRPFVLELRAPMRRTIPLAEAHLRVNERAAGSVEVSPMRFVRRDAVKWVKDLHATKAYRAVVEFERPVDDVQLQRAVNSLPGPIAQRTPRRVAHRRADRVRHRTLHEASGQWTDATHAAIEFRGDGGLYIKELVSGDDDRTHPSLSERLGVPACVRELDVLEVFSEEVPTSMESDDRVS